MIDSEEIKKKLKSLFLNYCDYNIDKAEVFVTQTSLLKMLKDAKIIAPKGLTSNEVCIAIQKTLHTKTNLIKAINFD